MALTRVNNQALTSITAAGLPTLTSSNMPTGSIVQTVQTTASSEWYNSSAATFEDVTGQSITITPSSSSNKILITLSAWGIINGAGGMGIRLLRGSTSIHQMESLVNSTPWSQGCYSFSFLDSPSTTSATTYKIQGASQVRTSNAEFRFTYNHSSISGSPQSTMIAQEIVG